MRKGSKNKNLLEYLMLKQALINKNTRQKIEKPHQFWYWNIEINQLTPESLSKINAQNAIRLTQSAKDRRDNIKENADKQQIEDRD